MNLLIRCLKQSRRLPIGTVELAKEKGSFPFLIGETDEETNRLREAFIQYRLYEENARRCSSMSLETGNSQFTLLTVAPTGSTGTMVGVSTGLEPYFSFTTIAVASRKVY